MLSSVLCEINGEGGSIKILQGQTWHFRLQIREIQFLDFISLDTASVASGFVVADFKPSFLFSPQQMGKSRNCSLLINSWYFGECIEFSHNWIQQYIMLHIDE